MQILLRTTSAIAVAGILLLAPACHNDGGTKERAATNQNAAGNNPAQANENRSRATETEGEAKTENANRSSEANDTSPEDFEGTAGVVEKKKTGIAPALLRVVRTARHEQFDRVVFEFDGNALPGYRLEYVDRPVRKCGSGEAVSLAGDAWLLVQFTPANAHTDAGEATVKDRERRLNLEVLKELKITCDFEAEVTWAMGLSRPNRYRVSELAYPARLVVDVKH